MAHLYACPVCCCLHTRERILQDQESSLVEFGEELTWIFIHSGSLIPSHDADYLLTTSFSPSALPNLLSVLPSDLDLSLSLSLALPLSPVHCNSTFSGQEENVLFNMPTTRAKRVREEKKTEPNYNTKSSALHILTILYPMPQDFRHTRCRSLHFSSSSFLLQSIKISTLFLAHAGFQAVWKTGMVHHGKKKDYQQKQNIARATLETDQKRGIMRVINE